MTAPTLTTTWTKPPHAPRHTETNSYSLRFAHFFTGQNRTNHPARKRSHAPSVHENAAAGKTTTKQARDHQQTPAADRQKPPKNNVDSKPHPTYPRRSCCSRRTERQAAVRRKVAAQCLPIPIHVRFGGAAKIIGANRFWSRRPRTKPPTDNSKRRLSICYTSVVSSFRAVGPTLASQKEKHDCPADEQPRSFERVRDSAQLDFRGTKNGPFLLVPTGGYNLTTTLAL